MPEQDPILTEGMFGGFLFTFGGGGNMGEFVNITGLDVDSNTSTATDQYVTFTTGIQALQVIAICQVSTAADQEYIQMALDVASLASTADETRIYNGTHIRIPVTGHTQARFTMNNQKFWVNCIEELQRA